MPQPLEDVEDRPKAKARRADSENRKLVDVLIVGDWLVDEHWAVGDHRAASSSRTGQRHSRALHGLQCSVKSLSGAGQVATVLHQARLAQGQCFRIYGIGLWHPTDTQSLQEMLDPSNNVGATPHCINSPLREPKPVANAQLFNLVDRSPETIVGTTRVIRLYAQAGDDLEVIHRIDWEWPISDSDRSDIEDPNHIDKNLRALLAATRGSHTHIILHDLGKGVVSRPLIDWLRRKYSSADWYVLTKGWKPKWYDDLPDANVRLLLIPQLAAWMAVRSERYRVSSWLTSGEQASQDALDAVSDLSSRFPKARIVVLPDGMKVLARDHQPAGGAHQGYVQPETGSAKTHLNVPMVSVFLPALVARLIGTTKNELEFFECLKTALNFTQEWMDLEERRVTDYSWEPSKNQILHLDRGPSTEHFTRWRTFSWEQAKSDWVRAFSELGVIEVTESKVGRKNEFQLWRAMAEIDGYVCCVPDKRRMLRILLEEGRSFGPLGRRRNKSFLLIDSPGSGKSYLASRLAKALNMRFLSFNVTQMLDRQDLLRCFDTIVTSQSQDPEQATLVFIDEVNGLLDGGHVYDAFLAPLEEGVYIRSGNTFQIAPCLWIFAGTESPKPSNLAVPHDRSEKGSDFVSRLTQPPFDLRQTRRAETNRQYLEMENLYVGVASIRSSFPDVRQVSTKVLKAFRILPQDAGPRNIAQFVKAFEYVQYGRVTSKNIPSGWFECFKISRNDSEDWERLDDKSFVEIKAVP